MTPVVVSWSGGKDAAWALHELRRRRDVEVLGLLSTVDDRSDLVGMHRVPAALLQAQAESLGLPLWRMPVAWPCPDEVYVATLAETLARNAPAARVLVFGDLFLDDIRAWRERMLGALGFEPWFPLWNRPTAALAEEMFDGGLRARVVCVDGSQLDPRWLGREWDARFVTDLPAGVDPCGERGEFHTLVLDGPDFRWPITAPLHGHATDGRFHWLTEEEDD